MPLFGPAELFAGDRASMLSRRSGSTCSGIRDVNRSKSCIDHMRAHAPADSAPPLTSRLCQHFGVKVERKEIGHDQLQAVPPAKATKHVVGHSSQPSSSEALRHARALVCRDQVGVRSA